jgi:hypothetical protein
VVAVEACLVGAVDHPLQGGVDLPHLAQAAVVEAGENAGGALLLRAFLQLRLTVFCQRSEVRLGVEKMLQKGGSLTAKCLSQFGPHSGVHEAQLLVTKVGRAMTMNMWLRASVYSD